MRYGYDIISKFIVKVPPKCQGASWKEKGGGALEETEERIILGNEKNWEKAQIQENVREFWAHSQGPEG